MILLKAPNGFLQTMLSKIIKQNYVSASILKNGRVVFNIKGKSYRLVVKFNYEKQWAFIRFIGTQPEYDKINAETFSIQLTMNLRLIKNETD